MDRSRVIALISFLTFLFLLGALFNLQIVQGEKLKSLSDKNCVRLLPQEGSRGMIFDRGGRLIVGNALAYDVRVMPKGDALLYRAFLKLSEVLNSDPDKLRKAYRNNYIAPFLPVTVSRNIDIRQAMAIEEVKFNLEGVEIYPHPVRFYPYGENAAQLIGYLGAIDRWRLNKLEPYGYRIKDTVGFGGIEEKFDYYLRQEDGSQSVNVDHRGRFVRLLGYKSPKSGRDIQLTLDIRIQKICEAAIQGRPGCVVILQPDSGEILAMANSPGFNPEAFLKKGSSEIFEVLNDRASPLLNRAISGLYPPASVFKVVVAGAGLETGKINTSSSFLCRGSVKIGNRSFKCWETHGRQDLKMALTHSCDIFFYKTGLLVGPKALHDHALKFGLGKPTGTDLPYESSGFVPSPLWKKLSRFQNWYDGDTANFAIGQGDLLVTPLQVARMMAALANGGRLVTPYIVKSIDGRDAAPLQKKAGRLGLRQNTLELIRADLRNVVRENSGTASILSNLPVAVSGKTGTAQASRGAAHGWFAGYLPSDDPRFVICVFLEHGGGGGVACAAAKQILEEMGKEGLL